ncbi:MAG TPA: hypothetical protein GX522_06845 [Firmicutes bacterium]|nr:hypothetical protein [Bacillota bacterium]
MIYLIIALVVIAVITIVAMVRRKTVSSQISFGLGLLFIFCSIMLLIQGGSIQLVTVDNVVELEKIDISKLLMPVIFFVLGVSFVVLSFISKSILKMKNLATKDPFAEVAPKKQQVDVKNNE